MNLETTYHEHQSRIKAMIVDRWEEIYNQSPHETCSGTNLNIESLFKTPSTIPKYFMVYNDRIYLTLSRELQQKTIGLNETHMVWNEPPHHRVGVLCHPSIEYLPLSHRYNINLWSLHPCIDNPYSHPVTTIGISRISVQEHLDAVNRIVHETLYKRV